MVYEPTYGTHCSTSYLNCTTEFNHHNPEKHISFVSNERTRDRKERRKQYGETKNWRRKIEEKLAKGIEKKGVANKS